MDMMVVVNTMVELFLLLILGYGLAKKGMIDSKTNGKLSGLVVHVSLPALILASVFENMDKGSLSEVFHFFLAGLGFYAVMIGFAWVLTRLSRTPKEQRGIYQFMLIFSNCAFMGYPIMEALYGTKAIFLSAIFNLPFNLLAFSYGIILISDGTEQTSGFEPKKLLSPGIIASVLALVIFAVRLHVPQVMEQTLNIEGTLTTPLSMLVLGASLAEVPLREVFREGRIYWMSFLRLIVLPMITYFLIKLITTDSLLIGVATMTAAMPVASLAVMLSSQYKGNVRLASVGVFISTALSVVTIPAIGWLITKI